MSELTPVVLVEWVMSLRPRIDEYANAVQHRFPNAKAQSFGGPIGSLTEFQGHDVGLEAVLPSGDVALTITAAYMTTTPRVFAVVAWGANGGGWEASTCDNCMSSRDWPLASPASLARIEVYLPTLVEALFVALERGGPA